MISANEEPATRELARQLGLKTGAPLIRIETLRFADRTPRVRGREQLRRLADCLSEGNFWPAETHRDPGGDKPQHSLAGVTIIIR
jgi:hypothetical protein